MSRARLRALGTALPGRAPRTLIVSVAVLAIAAVSLAVAPSAQATEIERRHHGEEVRIEARYPTALQGIDPLVFDVTRSEASVDDLDVRVTVSSGIVSARKLSYTVTIPAGEAEAVLSVPTGDPAPGAATGDVTATVDAASGYEVGDPSGASVRLHVGDPMVTVRFDQESYSVPEDTGLYTGIRLIARTAANVPAPKHPIPAAVFFESGTATSPEDYAAGLLLLSFGASGWAVDGDTYVSSSPVPLTPVDDSESEDDETLGVVLGAPPDLPGTVDFVAADGTACTDSCTAEVTILDDDNDDSGAQALGPLDVTIEAVYPTAVGGVDDLVFELVRLSTSDDDLEVPVTLSSGILASSELSHTVTFPAQETTAELSVSTENVVEGASTGDVIATVGDGDMHNVGHPSTATVRLYLGGGIVKVGLDAGSYRLDESVGTTTNEIRLRAATIPGVPAPRNLVVPIWTRDGTATSSDDYAELSEMVTFPEPWTAEDRGDGNAYMSEVLVPLSIIDDDEVEGDETFRLMVGFPPGSSGTVSLLTLDSAPPCDSEGCGSYITIVDDDRSVVVSQAELTVDEGDTAAYTVMLTREPTDDVTVTPEVQGAKNADITVSGPLTFTPQDWDTPQTVTVTAAADSNRTNGSATIAHPVTGGDYEANGVTAPSVEVTEWDAEGRTVVTLVHVPDGTVIPDNSTLTVGETVEDGSTFSEGMRVLFRLLFAAADGGPPVGGADVELSAFWSHKSPIVPTSGQISRVEFSLPRVTQWDTAIQILDNDVGNPDGTATIRITGCKRNGCVIGEPSEITVTIVDDDGGPEAAPPGNLDTPRLVCASSGAGYDSTGIAVSWNAPDFAGGAEIEGYEVQYRQRIGDGNPWIWGEWQAHTHAGAATSTAITGLDADTLYGVRVRALNANRPGQWSLPNTFNTGQSDRICEILDELTPGN